MLGEVHWHAWEEFEFEGGGLLVRLRKEVFGYNQVHYAACAVATRRGWWLLNPDWLSQGTNNRMLLEESGTHQPIRLASSLA